STKEHEEMPLSKTRGIFMLSSERCRLARSVFSENLTKRSRENHSQQAGVEFIVREYGVNTSIGIQTKCILAKPKVAAYNQGGHNIFFILQRKRFRSSLMNINQFMWLL